MSRTGKAKAVADKITSLRTIIAAGAVLLLVGFSASVYTSSFATKTDVKAGVEPVAAKVDEVDAQVKVHEIRIQVLEESFKHQVIHDRIRDEQIFHIAVKIGARVVPGIDRDAGP